jgi:hypothetical protein
MEEAAAAPAARAATPTAGAGVTLQSADPGGPAKSVSFDGERDSLPAQPISRKPTPFNKDLSDEIRRAGLDTVFPDEGTRDGACPAGAGELPAGTDVPGKRDVRLRGAPKAQAAPNGI